MGRLGTPKAWSGDDNSNWKWREKSKTSSGSENDHLEPCHLGWEVSPQVAKVFMSRERISTLLGNRAEMATQLVPEKGLSSEVVRIRGKGL